MDNRREHQRKALIHHLCVKDQESGEIIGFLDNISRGGLMLLSQAPITFNGDGVRTVNLVLPSDQPWQGEISLAVHNVWSEKDEDAKLYATGMRFVNAPSPLLRQIDNLLRELGSREFA